MSHQCSLQGSLPFLKADAANASPRFEFPRGHAKQRRPFAFPIGHSFLKQKQPANVRAKDSSDGNGSNGSEKSAQKVSSEVHEEAPSHTRPANAYIPPSEASPSHTPGASSVATFHTQATSPGMCISLKPYALYFLGITDRVQARDFSSRSPPFGGAS